MPPSRWRTHAVTLISTPGGPAFPTGEPAEFDSAAEHCVCRVRTASIGAAQGAPPPCSIDIASLSGPTPGASMSSAVDTAADRPTPQGGVGRSAPYQYALLMDRNRQGETTCQRSCPTPGMRCSAATPKVARVVRGRRSLLSRVIPATILGCDPGPRARSPDTRPGSPTTNLVPAATARYIPLECGVF